MGCCSSPRTTVAGVGVLHLFGALGCIGLCSYLLSLEGPKLEQILTQSWTLLTTMHLPVVVDAEGNVVPNHTRSSTEAATLSNKTHSHARGRSAYDIQPLLDDSKNDVIHLQTAGPELIASDEYLKYDNESAEVGTSSVLDRDPRILLSEDDLVINITESSFMKESHPNNLMTKSSNIESSESNSDLYDYITENIPLLPNDTESFHQNTSSENFSSSMENENVTEVPIIDLENLRNIDELLFPSVSTTEDTNAVSLNSDSSVLYVDVPGHTITSISTGSTEASTNDSNTTTRVTKRIQVTHPHQDETSTTFSPSNTERNDMEANSPAPRNFLPNFPNEDFITSTEFIPVSPENPSAVEYTTATSTLEAETSSLPVEFTVTPTSRSTSTSRTPGSSTVSSTASSTPTFENEVPSTSETGFTSMSPPSSARNSTSAAPEPLPSALPLQSHNAVMYSHLVADENSSSVNVELSGKTSNISMDEEPFTITVPPIITTTGFLSTLLTSGTDTEGDPELESLLFELRAGASVLGLLVYFIVCAIAAAVLIASAIWRLEGLMVPWLVMEWISVFAAITAVGVLTWVGSRGHHFRRCSGWVVVDIISDVVVGG
ncbi:hypothetical protein FHG87_013350 [Trinorchestia longiramus]|nr:hypothetical protein FHG87_013350 [Trinorchestia longiramus]